MILQQKKVYINPLSGIHYTSLISAYFGLDSRECVYNIYIYTCHSRFIPDGVAQSSPKFVYRKHHFTKVQLTAHQTLYFGLCTALIISALVLISNCKCVERSAVDADVTDKNIAVWSKSASSVASKPLVSANDCKCSRDQWLHVPSEVRKFKVIFSVTHRWPVRMSD
jgi:hypothetical protein